MKAILINLIGIISMGAAQNTIINYKLSMPEPCSHLFHVKIDFENISENDSVLTLSMPAWRPGRYFIFDFASGVQEFNATDKDGERLKWYKCDKSTWVVNTQGNKFVAITYKVFANSFHLRTRGLDERHGFVNGTAVFMYSEKHRDIPLILEVLPYNSWHVSTGLQNIEDKELCFYAENYDELADCPLEIGTQKDVSFELRGKQFVISFFGDVKFDSVKLIKDFSKIIEAIIDFWGCIPFNRYVFIIHCTPQSSGGTEHINSTVVGVKPEAFDDSSEASKIAYNNFLNLISHEFFHTWNVKQLRPKSLTPYDYKKENYTEELWIAEGSTSYYDGLILLRTGQQSLEKFLEEITIAVKEDKKRPGNRIQSLAESSFDAWIKFWKQNPNSYDAETDYYAKGSWVSLLLDLKIRHLTLNKYSLDDVFRKMLSEFPIGTGYTNADFIKICEEITGVNLKVFFNDYLYGTKLLEWEKYLFYAGLKLDSIENIETPSLGIKIEYYGEKIVITEVASESISEKKGIKTGDVIIAVDDLMLSYEDINTKLKSLEPGQKIKLTVIRNNKLHDYILIIKDITPLEYMLRKVVNPTELQKSIYETWLKHKWDED